MNNSNLQNMWRVIWPQSAVWVVGAAVCWLTVGRTLVTRAEMDQALVNNLNTPHVQSVTRAEWKDMKDRLARIERKQDDLTTFLMENPVATLGQTWDVIQ